ncbi:MFS transporter [Pigmentiphaga aceris]|uniref:MFS transporter n=1 Tax=Pigmentiphaga aceris TaxID=1940612 RepID=A0A5C0B3F7_9BURK|nr:MFS transporter [Pigmentiphaga aceris]QEI07750.1 MFS transporter [Pigmentiphaga aceris]
MNTRAVTAVAARRRRVVVAEVIGACLLILVLAQALTAALGLAAFNRLSTATTAERVELLARDTAAKIEGGLRLGKPIAQYFGLAALLDRNFSHLPDLVGATVLLPDGYVLAQTSTALPGAPALAKTFAAPASALQTDSDMSRLRSGAVMMTSTNTFALAVPLHGRQSQLDGVLVLAVDNTDQAAREQAFLHRTVMVLGLTTLAAAIFLIVALGWVVPFDTLTRPGGRARLAVPLIALILAQGVYSADTIASFRSAWLENTRANVTMLVGRMQADIGRVLDMGISIDRLRGVDTLFTRLASTLPAIEHVSLRDSHGRVLVGADARGPRQVAPTAAPMPGEIQDELQISLPVSMASAGGYRIGAGTLDVRLDAAVIAAGVRSRVLDAGTVALISAITAFEMFLLLTLVMARTVRAQARANGTTALLETESNRAENVARVARPLMFGFLFAWALPLSFMPLYARTLPVQLLSLPPDILLALPLSVEMLCGLGGALLAGRLTDRRGWPVPVLGGLVVAACGSLLASSAVNLEWFALARGVVGLGYGLAWMGLQGFVIAGSKPAFRGRNMAWLVAGLFAGHLSGTAVGAMLADQAGYRPVFIASAVVLMLPLIGAFVMARRWKKESAAAAMSAGAVGGAAEGSVRAAAVVSPVSGTVTRAGSASGSAAGITPKLGLSARAKRLGALIGSRDFGALLAGSVVPFSIAQVGLLYFALPLYLEAQGVAASSIGRVLMLYGLCMIYLGPMIGRVVDRTRTKKYFIALGGLLGGTGMAYLYVDSSLFAVSMAVFLLALGSCWSGAAQTTWTLALPNVQQYGAGAATSVMRAADKLGQMIGPLFVGTLFTLVGIGPGLAMTGMVYLVATMLFVLVASRQPGEGGAGVSKR